MSDNVRGGIFVAAGIAIGLICLIEPVVGAIAALAMLTRLAVAADPER